MGTEIERKFLVRDHCWRQHVYRSEEIRQGYLISNDRCSVRVRIAGETAQLNIKSGTLGVSRREYEYTLTVEDARKMLSILCVDAVLEKTRHFVHHRGHNWEIDVFAGDNTGLVVAEVELKALDEPIDLPLWAGEEVSYDIRYYNPYLVKRPYKSWS